MKFVGLSAHIIKMIFTIYITRYRWFSIFLLQGLEYKNHIIVA